MVAANTAAGDDGVWGRLGAWRQGEVLALKKSGVVVRGNNWKENVEDDARMLQVSEVAPVPSSSEPCHLKSAVYSTVKSALDNIDFEMHCGTHPRLGIVDHICCHPLANVLPWIKLLRVLDFWQPI
ncbi:hypothetical protein K1719_008535 [Acacia pycnantha]|nr:hypothetical protein K1719_008535 [Acacia pycnantha]